MGGLNYQKRAWLEQHAKNLRGTVGRAKRPKKFRATPERVYFLKAVRVYAGANTFLGSLRGLVLGGSHLTDKQVSVGARVLREERDKSRKLITGK